MIASDLPYVFDKDYVCSSNGSVTVLNRHAGLIHQMCPPVVSKPSSKLTEEFLVISNPVYDLDFS